MKKENENLLQGKNKPDTKRRGMNIGKGNMLRVILISIFLIVFNSLYFVLGGIDRNASVWISYCFIHFAYFMLLFTPRLVRAGKSAAVFSFSLYAVTSAYFLLEFVIGVMFIMISPNSYQAAFFVQLVIAGIYGIAIVSNMFANEHTADAEEKRQPQIDYVKKASAQLKGVLERVADKNAKKKVERAYDTLSSSPVKSHPDLASLEDRILKFIHALENAVSAENSDTIIALAGSLETAIHERNRQLKTSH